MSEFKRQHPISIFVSFFSNLKQMIITLVVLFFFGSSQTRGPWYYLIVLGGLLVFSFLSGFLHWLTFRYRLEEQELHIRHGLIFRKKRFIHRDRVQSIDLNAKVIQRMFNLVEVRIETAGGGEEPEFRIIALNKNEANDIRKELLYGKKKVVKNEEDLSLNAESTDEDQEAFEDLEEVIEEENEKEPDYKWSLSTKRLLIAALTSSGIGVAATFVAAIFSQFQQFIPETWYETAVGFLIESSIAFILSFIIFVVIVAWMIRFVSTVLKYGNFTLEKTGNDIVISRGLLERRQLTLNKKRITAVRLVQNVLRQPFGYTSVYVESAGGGTKDEDLSTILIPLCKEKEVMDHLEAIAPEFSFERPMSKLPKKSMRRYVIRLTVPAILVASFLTYFIDYGYYSFIAILFALGLGYWQYKDAGIGVNDRFLWMRTRKFARTTVVVPKKRIQTIEVSSNPLQRLNDLTTLEVSILTSITGKTFALNHLSEQQSIKYFTWYSYEEPTDNKKRDDEED